MQRIQQIGGRSAKPVQPGLVGLGIIAIHL
jgi:hypothetical protein